ncbi:MAG: lysine 2,3-aminomutase [Bdellovibrio sp. ArHS]|uniref:KamA family radical SAM protein n=1 Tax=Bdellovibrio sp. ArHS TaxID=1569284 RepID=UPI0005836F48|nr:KamA family radical SAM protein [Bdellovibrio sp. ArHS]KHD89256.1 MAG: lysine 2,3-aminomutase [Bdellovibrio sp. ArHS]
MKFSFPPSPKPEHISQSDWNNWTWQLRHSLKTQNDFAKHFVLTDDEKAAFDGGKELFNVRTTPYYASLAGEAGESIRQILMPHRYEIEEGLQQMVDPLGEKKNNPAPRVIHRYSDRALFLITDICSVYCRFCTRKHFTGQEQAFIRNDEYEQALNYIRQHSGLREVILSGGDPLTVSDAQLDRVLTDLRNIEHIEIIRIGSRMPVVCPMRVTDDLVRILKKHKPVFLMSHFNHPRELTAEAVAALERFVDNGIPVMNQMVLLNGINNHPAIVQALNRRLLYLRVKPYYMFQCDPSIGTDHLRTSVEDSLQIQKELWGHLSGLAMPNLSLDIPNGGGKTYLVPNFEVGQEGLTRHYVGWDGVKAEYVSPAPEKIKKPDASLYEDEWRALKNSKSQLETL